MEFIDLPLGIIFFLFKFDFEKKLHFHVFYLIK